ncbi:hypothetical protein PUN28_016786 [Cardiocondyla obscurior]
MTITPVAPCYMKSAGFTQWQPLKLGITVPIKPNDICSLLPDKCWFKIVSVTDTMENGDQASEREFNQEDANNEADSIRVCLLSSMEAPASPHQSLNDILHVKTANEHEDCPNKGDGEQGDVVTPPVAQIDSSSSPEENNMPATSSKMSTDSQNLIEPSVKHENNRKRKAKNINLINKTATNGESGKKIKWDCIAYFSSPAHAVPDESLAATADYQVKASNPDRVPREKCMYGPQCYRKNHNHKNNYSHPDDSDYDGIDDRQECPYGAKCYRKNPQHKTQFKHTTGHRRRRRAGTPLNPELVNNVSETDESSVEESVDESDYDPSVYTESSDDCDDKSESEDGTTG